MAQSMMERVARAVFRASFADDEMESAISALWEAWDEDRDSAFRNARAALLAAKEIAREGMDHARRPRETKGGKHEERTYWDLPVGPAIRPEVWEHAVLVLDAILSDMPTPAPTPPPAG